MYKKEAKNILYHLRVNIFTIKIDNILTIKI